MTDSQQQQYGTQPGPDLQALDDELKKRFAKRAGTLTSFLREWIKLPESQERLFKSVGPDGQNYLQFKLATNDIAMSYALVEICDWFAETNEPEAVVTFLHVIDKYGNDLWHYLANCLAREEQDDALSIARNLIQLQIDYCRKNNDDESALSKLLLPKPRWKSINSMNQVRQIELAELKICFSNAVNHNQALFDEVIFGVFADDQRENKGKLTQLLLEQALRPQADADLRNETKEIFYGAVGGPKRENLLLLVAEIGAPAQFEMLLRLLNTVIEYDTRELAARDLQVAKAERQRLLTANLSLRNRANQTVLFKGIRNRSDKIVSSILSLLTNESLVVPARNRLGQNVTRSHIIDMRSPAPSNPRLTLLLQQDNLGNTALHLATFLSREKCVRAMLIGLSPVDIWMMLTRIPNKLGLTIQDMLDLTRCRDKLTARLKSGAITAGNAQQAFAMAKKISQDAATILKEQLSRAEDMVRRSGGPSEVQPTFDLRRIPTVALLRTGGADQQPAVPANG